MMKHLAAFSIFGRLTRVLLEGDYDSLSLPGLWAAGWFAAGGAMVVFLGLLALPARVWGRLAVHEMTHLAMPKKPDHNRILPDGIRFSKEGAIHVFHRHADRLPHDGSRQRRR